MFINVRVLRLRRRDWKSSLTFYCLNTVIYGGDTLKTGQVTSVASVAL